MSTTEERVRDALDRCGIEVVEEKGTELWALCPSPDHKDRNPSWSISTETGTHFCFSCHYRGNAYTLVSNLIGKDAATNLLGRKDAPPVQRLNRSLDRDWTYHTVADLDRNDWAVSEAQLLSYTDPPQWALDARRLDRGSVDLFGVRWSGKDDAWVLPLRRPEGLVGYQIKAQGRPFVRNRPVGMDKSRTLFGLLEARGAVQVVLVESPLDAVRLRRLRYPAMALCGSRMSDTQRDLLQHYDRVLLALDNDDSGRVETERILRSMPGFDCWPVDYGDTEATDFGDMEDSDVERIIDAIA